MMRGLFDVACVSLLLATGCERSDGTGAAPPRVVAVSAHSGPAGTAAPAERRAKQCRFSIEHRERGRVDSTTSELTIVEAGGDPVEIRATQGSETLIIERSYDVAHRFVFERRRERGPHPEKLTTFTWERDENGRVRRAERAIAPVAGSTPGGHTIVSTVLEMHPSGRWLRRETRDPMALVRTETRTFDGEGRVLTLTRTEGPASTIAGTVETTQLTYAGPARTPKTESVKIAEPNQPSRAARDLTYDERGRLVEAHVWKPGDEEGLWSVTYDADGRIASRSRPDGFIDSYMYSGDCPLDVRALLKEPNSADD